MNNNNVVEQKGLNILHESAIYMAAIGFVNNVLIFDFL